MMNVFYDFEDKSRKKQLIFKKERPVLGLS